MKNLILVLFAIVTFSFIGNAQDLSFKTFNQTVKPKGDLVATVNFDGDRTDYIYQEWDEYSVTQWQFIYLPREKSVLEVKKQRVFFDELDFKKVSFNESAQYKYCDAKILAKQGKNAVLFVSYNKDKYSERADEDITFTLNNKKEADIFIEKIKEKGYDMSLELDLDNVERVKLTEIMVYDESNPDGISYAEYMKSKEESGSSSESSSSSDEDEESSTTSTTNSSSNTTNNNSKPKVKTEVRFKLYNKSNKLIDIKYEERGAGASKVATSISSRATRSVTMKIGGRVYGASGNVLLVVTADMEDTEQVIAQ